MSVRANCWSITINNPTQTDEYNISQARQKGWKVHGQLEKGENGTPHYQIMLRTPQVRFSAVKSIFPRAHIEVSRNPTALAAYVQKDETRVGQLQLDQGKYPTQLQLFQWFSSYWYNIKPEKKNATNLEIFDLMIAQKIAQGYMIGAEVMNPQIRAFIKKFGDQLALRHRRTLDRQTDRQPDLFSQHVSIPNAVPSQAPVQEETSDPPSSSDDEGSSQA